MAAEVAQQPPPPSAPRGDAGATTATRKLLFGKYEMGRLLGKGTFAKVYCAKNVSTNESFAIKVLSKDHIRREGLVDQILREISALRLVRHPHVIHLQEVMATRSQIFFVMELVRGGELFAKIARGKLKEDVARSYFQQLISAVDFCHSRGVSHRDLKPENLLLDDDGNLKISDFGLSALPEQRWTDGLLHTQCGTPAYVAPEVLRKKGYDGAKADLWSCGVILYVLLAGFLPFQHENLMKMYSKIFKAEFEWPRWFSAGARRLISRLLVADPEKRITMDGILNDPWFNKGYTSPAEDDSPISVPVPLPAIASEKGPAFYNAFELISAMSSGFDLSRMFETGKKTGTIFTSRRSAGEIMERLQSVGRDLGFDVLRDKVYRVRLEGKRDARRVRLAVTAEVFQVAPDVAVVEFSQSAGDAFEYAKFCEVDVRPGLRDIVWTWQGE